MVDLIVLLMCIVVIKNIVAEQLKTEEVMILHKFVMGMTIVGVIASLLGMINILSKSVNMPESNIPDNMGANDLTDAVLNNTVENSNYNQLADNLFSIVDSDTGVVMFNTEQLVREKLNLLCGVDIENYDFDSVKKKKGTRYSDRLYKYTVVSSGKKPESTNSFGEWTVAQLDNSVYIEGNTSDVNLENPQINTVLHIGVDGNTSKSEAEIYLPSTKSKTYLCLADVQRGTNLVNLYPIFFSIEPNKYYIVKPNLYKLGLDGTDIENIDSVLKMITTTKQDNSLIEKHISSDINNVTLTITGITDTEIVGTIENKNTFEIYIDGSEWFNNEDTIGENLLRVKAKTSQDFRVRYNGEIKAGDIITLEGEMKDVDAAFSSIGKIKFRFKVI